MKYELKDYKQNGSVTDNGNGTSTVPIIVKAGIVGDTYGFVSPNWGSDTVNVTFANSKTKIEIDAIAQAEAVAYVAKKYPDK